MTSFRKTYCFHDLNSPIIEEKKLPRLSYGRHKFEWIHRREKLFKGIGTALVRTTGKRAVPMCFRLSNSGLLLPGIVESHEQPGTHPLLLSDSAQAQLGMVKDMRLGQVKLKDHDDYLDIYRAEGSGLKVVCISHFPPEMIPELFVESTAKRIRAADERKKKHSPCARGNADSPCTRGNDGRPLPQGREAGILLQAHPAVAPPTVKKGRRRFISHHSDWKTTGRRSPISFAEVVFPTSRRRHTAR